MKKNRFFWASAAIAALTLTACADQDEFNQNDVQNAAVENAPGAIQFGTYLGKTGTTRAEVPVSYVKGTIGNKTDAVLGLTELKAARFGVFGYYTGTKDYRTISATAPYYSWTESADAGKWKKDATDKYPNFFYNQEIVYDDAAGKDAWVYDPVKYWPNGVDKANDDSNPNVSNTPSNTATELAAYANQKLSFFAFAPFTAATTTDYTTPTGEADPTGVTAVTTANTESGVTAISKNDSPTDVWVKYLMPYATASEAVDLLWGLAGKDAYRETDANNPAKTIGSDYNENLTKQVVPERVKFLFKHALAKMAGATSKDDETLNGEPLKCGLMVVADVDYNSTTPTVDGQSKQGTDYFPSDFDRSKTLITLKSVKVQDGKSASSDAGAAVTGQESTLLTRGWFDIETGKWCEDDDTYGVDATNGGATYNITASYTDKNVNDNATYSINYEVREPDDKAAVDALLESTKKKTWDGDNTKNKPQGVDIGTPKPVFANENVPALLFIPTGEGSETSNQKIYVTVDYMVRTADPNLKLGYSEVEQVITNEVILNGQKLDPNKYYTLIMHLGMTSVKFEAVVTDWSSNTGDEFAEDGSIIEQGTTESEVVWLPSNVINKNIVATIAGGNYFSNRKDHEKVITINYDGAEISDYSNVTFPDLPAWLEWDAVNKKLKTKTDNDAVANNEATITLTYVHTNAESETTTLTQKIDVVQYGKVDLDVTATPGKGEGGKFSPIIDATEKVYLTVKLRGKNVVIDGTDCVVEVQTASTDWLEWDGTDNYLKVKLANTGNEEPTQNVKVTYTDADLGVYTKTITLTQAAANLVVNSATFNLAKEISASSALNVKLNNVIDVTDAVTVEIPTTPTDANEWLKYNSTAKTFESKTANGGTEDRTATVRIKYGTLYKDVIVTQAH